jgi:hypothetical protein
MKDYLKTLCGLTQNVLSECQMLSLRAAIGGAVCTPRDVLRALRVLGIQKRHRKRVYTLAVSVLEFLS